MDKKDIHVSAPGKLMMLGEHAVLHGKLSLVCAVNRRIHVKLKPRHDDRIIVNSSLGQYRTTLEQLEIIDPYTFVLATVHKVRPHLKHGFNLEITSEFSERIGFGSSAAVTVSTLTALMLNLEKTMDPTTIFEDALAIVRQVQGKGSGADIAASVFGGIIAYRSNPREIIELAGSYPITVVYSGYKTPTTTVIKTVETFRNDFQELVDPIFDLMDKSSTLAKSAINAHDWKKVGQLFNINQGFMEALGVGDRNLSSLVYDLRKEPGIVGAKISGSGLGDCIIGLGEVSAPSFKHEIVPISIEKEGIKIH